MEYSIREEIVVDLQRTGSGRKDIHVFQEKGGRVTCLLCPSAHLGREDCLSNPIKFPRSTYLGTYLGPYLK